MPLFAVTYTYNASHASTRAENLDEHRAWLRPLDEADRIIGAGIFPDGSGSLQIFVADDLEAMRAELARDPFARLGLIEAVDVRQWNPNWGLVGRHVAGG